MSEMYRTCLGRTPSIDGRATRWPFAQRHARRAPPDPVRTTRKNAVREWIQRRVKHDRHVAQRKAQLAGHCPECGTDGHRLHSACVGKSASDAIDAVLDEHPGEHNIGRLVALVQAKHQAMHLTPQRVCCSECNTRLAALHPPDAARSPQVAPVAGGGEVEWRSRWQSEGLVASPTHRLDCDALD